MSPRTYLGRITFVVAMVPGFAACVQQPTDLPERDPGAPVGTATQAISAPALPVKVANTDAEAVPTKATGTTTVAGSVAAAQSGSWNVGINGTPTVNAQQSGGWDVNVAGDVSLAPGSTVVAQQGGGPWSVNVAGTPTVALAPGGQVGVSGAVSVASMPAVNVANMPAVNVASMPAVSIANTPSVHLTNDPSSPVYVTSVAAVPALQAFEHQVSIGLADGDSDGVFDLATIPAGKRLVVEGVTALLSVPTGENVYFVLWGPSVDAPSELTPHYLVPKLIGPDFFTPGNKMWALSEPHRQYANPGVFSIAVWRSASAQWTGATFTVTGYLVDLP